MHRLALQFSPEEINNGVRQAPAVQARRHPCRFRGGGVRAGRRSQVPSL